MSDIDIAIMFVEHYSDVEDVFNRVDIIEIGRKYFKDPVDVVNLAVASLLLKYTVVQEGRVIKDDGVNRAEFESLTLREIFDFRYYSDRYNNVAITRIKEGSYFGGDQTG